MAELRFGALDPRIVGNRCESELVDASGREDPAASLAGHQRDEVKVYVVVKNRQVECPRRGGPSRPGIPFGRRARRISDFEIADERPADAPDGCGASLMVDVSSVVVEGSANGLDDPASNSSVAVLPCAHADFIALGVCQDPKCSRTVVTDEPTAGREGGFDSRNGLVVRNSQI